MEKKEIKKILLLGISAFAVFSAILRVLIVPFLLEIDVFEGFRWFYQIGIILLVLGAVAFIFERRKKLPFFYGKSQSAGSNANSFFLLAIGINCIDLNLFQFTVSIGAAALIMYFAGLRINRTVQEESDM